MTKILLIEDEALLRQEVLDWLTFEGYEAVGAEDGLAGVAAALRFLPDIIVCDITMPRLDGYGVLLELRANPATVAIPFIFVTARASHEDVRKGMASGADDYITKPFTRAELFQAIESRLSKKQALEQEATQEIDQLKQSLAQEREQRLLKAKFVAMFSHDFRNPLTSIISSNSLLRDYGSRMDEPRRLSHHNRVDASAQRLIQMLDDMLLLMQMDTGNLEFKPEPVNLEQLVQQIVDEFQAIHLETHPITFECGFHSSAQADPRLLRSIAVNLISNAVKYSPPGSTVHIALEGQDDQFVLSVADEGIGIPEADQPRLFAAFQRGSNVGEISGTGLGLAIVKEAVDLHGGTIRFESRVNAGTRIEVAIPVREAA